MFKTIREPIAAHGIRVNLINPWFMKTPLTSHALDAMIAAGAPIGRIEDVVTTVIRCVADASIYVRQVF